jgi:acylphosphatase
LVTGESVPSVLRVTAWLRGQVQGVGMRWWIRGRALERGLVGSARNLPDGRVEVVAQGARASLDDLLVVLRSGAGPGRVDVVIERWSEPRAGVVGFVELP